MKKSILPIFLIMWMLVPVTGQEDSTILSTEPTEIDQTEINKKLALDFYRDLWFTNNTDKYIKYVADEYIVHDIGDRKNAVERAIEQKKIADFFWSNGTWESEIDYQIAEGDLVATRWTAKFNPETLLGRVFIGDNRIPIINVFRFEDGKIVEIWNHRHDIDMKRTNLLWVKGFLIGLLIALIPTIIVFRQRRKIKRLSSNE